MIKYPDLYRLKYNHINLVPTKRYIDDPNGIFDDEIVMQEKVDGSQLAIGYIHDYPYAQGKNSHLPDFDKRKAYTGVWSWIWNNIEKIMSIKGYLIFGEWAHVQHSLEYELLPDWFIAFDVYDKKAKTFLIPEEAKNFCISRGFQFSKILYTRKINYMDVPEFVDGCKSAYSNKTNMEGCVIKNRKRPMFATKKESIWWTNCGKYVCQEFLDNFEDDSHWTSHRLKLNKLMDMEFHL